MSLLLDFKFLRHNKIELEPKRDWGIGFVSGHRVQVLFFLIICVFTIFYFQSTLWNYDRVPKTFVEIVWSWGSLLWIAPSIFGTFGVLGLLIFRHPRNLNGALAINNLVSWRIVSRGINVEVLTSTIRRCQEEMKKNPLFPYIIEVIIDKNEVQILPPNNDVRCIIVPGDYKTPNNSLFKARALHYASKHSPLPDKAWIVHLDEETQPTASGVKGIAQMIKEEEDAKTYKIGQGAILYHREWSKYPVLTLADNIRTGVDFAQFHLQHRLGLLFFGFHGSYIVVKNRMEKSTGFDFGYQGSITEDAFWGMVAMERGYRSRWVDGYLEEQSTQSVVDFIKQRRRWMQGLAKVTRYAPVNIKWRLSLGINTFLWNLGPFASIYTVLHFFYGFEHPWWIMLLANYSLASSILIYLVGLEANLFEHNIKNFFKRLGWILVQICLFPLFSLMESIGVLAAVFKPTSGFHVVKR